MVNSQVLRAQLHTRLLTWDPLGIANDPAAQHKYDCLLDPVLTRLALGCTESELTATLIIELETHLHMHAESAREHRLAASLVAWWAEANPAPG